MKKTGLTILGIAAALFLTKLIVRACSDFGYSDDANNLVYFHDDLADPVTFSPFYYVNYKKLYDNRENDSLLAQMPDANIAEWVQYSSHSFTARDADSFIYKSDVAYITALKDHTPLHGDAFAGNSMKAWLMQSAHTDALTYLLFSKRCEPYNQPAFDEDKWVYKPLNKDSAMQLFQEG